MTPIPTFPVFRRLESTDRPAIEAVTRRFPPFSDYGFTSLWSWDTDETCAVALLDRTLVVRFKEYTTDASFYSFLGDAAVTETAQTLLAHARDEGLPARLKLVPEAVIAADDRLSQCLRVAEDSANHDYVYSIADWATLPGEPFRGHQRRIARLRRRAALEFRLLEPRHESVQAAMLALFHCWAVQKPAGDGEDRRHELAALKRLFALLPIGGDCLGACGLYDGDRLVAFSIWEGIPGSDYTVTHFRKTDRTYDGLAAYLRHEESPILLDRGYRLMNVEQDLGIPGLRRAKLALRPCQFLRKYTIREKPGEEDSTDERSA